MGAEVAKTHDDSKETNDVFEVWPENWEAVTAFLAVQTQWRALALPVGIAWLGLDYSAAEAVFRRHGLSDDGFYAVQAMELTALAVFSEAS